MHGQMVEQITVAHPMKGHLEEVEEEVTQQAKPQAWQVRAEYRHRVIRCRRLLAGNLVTGLRSLQCGEVLLSHR